VVPIAMLACVVKGSWQVSWQVFVQLVLLAVLTYGIRLWGTVLITSHEKQQSSYQMDMQRRYEKSTTRQLYCDIILE
jgi:hypothetical protein